MNARQRRIRLRHNARCPRGYIGPKYGDWRVHYKREMNAPLEFRVMELPPQLREDIEAAERQHAERVRLYPNIY